MFEVGDLIIHGSTGVCEILAVGRPEVDYLNQERIYYTLRPIYQKGSKIYTPADNDKVPMRRIMSLKEIWQLIEDIPGIEPLQVTDDKYFEEQYKECIRRYDCRELVRIIKTVYLRNKERQERGKKISSVEEKYLTAAEDFLYGEMALILDIPKEKVESYIAEKIDGAAVSF